MQAVNSMWWRRLLTGAVLILVVLGLLAGCGTIKTWHAGWSMYDKNNAPESPAPELHKDPYLLEVAQKFGLYALFAGVVYRNDYADYDERDKNGCDYLGPGKQVEKHLRYGMPGRVDGERWIGWERWKPEAEDGPVKACFDREGLYYETYVLRNAAGEMEAAVIAYRGTENYGRQFILDWKSNASALFGFEPTQYALAKYQLKPLVEALEQKLKKSSSGKVDLVAVGHSLGGGLAQQAGYLAPQIDKVVTFNPSPVTNWSSLRYKGQVNVAYPAIYRIYHTGEVLDKVRFVTTAMTSARYARHDIGLQLTEKSNIGGHSMQVILCGFAAILAQSSTSNTEAYSIPLDFNPTDVTNNASLCPKMKSASDDGQASG
jgi:hypothetical protein